jgi:protein involved in polysaccharide export with SLBB domain
LTREEAMEGLKKAYSALFQDPQLTLSIVQAHSKTFAVIGDVSQPGEYPYLKPINLIDSIDAAGGIRLYQRGGDSFVGSQGQLVKAVIIRNKGEKREVIERDLRHFQRSGPHPSETRVFPGDIVYVPESINLVYVLGEVKGAGVFAATENMTLLQLLSKAGGFVEQTGRLRHVVLLREEQPGQTKVMLVNVKSILKKGGDIRILPGDIVYVPRKPLVNLQAFVSRFTGSISPILSLYRQAYDAYYAKDYFDKLLSNSTTSDVLAIQQGTTTTTNATDSILSTTTTGAK